MDNSTHFSTIILTGYIDIGNIKYLFFFVLVLLFVAILVANQLIIGIICKEKSLHEPMYVFVCSLSVNELYGSIALFPSLLSNMLLSKIPEVSLTFCHIQIFTLYTYASVEFCNLAVMSYDRYVAICHPLEYHRIMSPAMTATLIALGCVRLKLCGNVMDKVWCDNYMLVKLACSDTTAKHFFPTMEEAVQRNTRSTQASCRLKGPSGKTQILVGWVVLISVRRSTSMSRSTSPTYLSELRLLSLPVLRSTCCSPLASQVAERMVVDCPPRILLYQRRCVAGRLHSSL
ncbi:olfactory receptor 142-like [Puntigrus tetrazona]|uniref:olfactory receptor 142-like n=1 Tax=Puntigrus tetrazona TaxID=1606681 RepID=UPI001C8937A4|nr:olfactory receptor 142-like [Puntigrus tetrazona]